VHLILVGISHRTAPVELRERLDFQARGLDKALRVLATRRAAAREVAILSTCNRAEMYAFAEDADAARSELVGFFSEFHGIDPETVLPHVYEVRDLEAARHLFRVAAGLDSLVVGEPQILGQVKEAHTAATAAQSSGPLLNRLFHNS
jgi:glutamyl-tRNA reductase